MRDIIIPNVKIAVVDEDVFIRNFVVSALMYSVNRDVLAFDNGFEAWIHFEEAGFPDVMLADVHLEEIDGFALLSKVKARSAKTIVVMISDNYAHEATARELGADAFLAKPFGVNALFDLVQTFIAAGDYSPAVNGKRDRD